MIAALLALLAGGLVPLPFDAAARAGLPAARATLSSHGKSQVCDGVWLADLAARAGLSTGKAVAGPALATVIYADAADGYRVVFTLGELDASLGHVPVLVADRCDGKPLAATEGPVRLVVPGDARGARSVRQLKSLAAEVLSP